MGEPPLAGLTVLDVGHIVAAPYATLVLADLGAEVIKVEHPDGGDRARTGSPTFRSMFQTFNRDKRSYAVDLRDAEERETFYRLVEVADVLVENFAPGTPEKLGIDYPTLAERNSGLVYASIKGYAAGPYGDRLSNDPVAEAMSGLMAMTGERDGPPVRVGASPVDVLAASNAVIGILATLLTRASTGRGGYVRAPLFEAAVSLTSYWLTFRQLYDEEPRRSGAALYTQMVPYDTYETAGGALVFVGCPTERAWESLKGVLDVSVPEDVEADRTAHAEAVNEAVEAATRTWDSAELVEALSAAGVQAAPVNGMAEVLADPHLEAIELFAAIDARAVDGAVDAADVRVPHFPLWADGFAVGGAGTDPPALGEHTDAIVESLER